MEDSEELDLESLAASIPELAITKALCEKKYREFIEFGWPIIEPTTRFIPNWHIDAIAEHMEAVRLRQIRNLLINMPPRHMKSTIVSVMFCPWIWATEPTAKFLYSSYAAELAIRDSVKARNILTSPQYQLLWGDKVQFSKDQNKKARFTNSVNGHRIATSVDGSATGEGGDYIVVDDPHNVREKDSEIKIEQVLEWWDNTMSTRLNDPKTGCKIIVMQRVAPNDLSAHVLKKEGYVHLCLPAEFEPERKCVVWFNGAPVPISDIEPKTDSLESVEPQDAKTKFWEDPRELKNELLWPDRFGKTEIEDAKNTMTAVAYAGQFQQRPAPKGGSRFKLEWIRRFTHSIPGNSRVVDLSEYAGEYHLSLRDGGLYNVPVADCRRFAVVDPAGTDKEQNDRACYTVLGIFAATPKKDLILLDIYRDRLDIPAAAKMIVEGCRKYNCWVGIESNGLGLGVIRHVRTDGIPVREIVARGNKEARSETAEIRMEGGQIYLPHRATWLRDFEEEIALYPNASYVDQVDVLSHAANFVAYKSFKTKNRSTPFALGR